MDEDLQAVTTLLDTPEPTTQVVDEGRHRLQNAALSGPRRVRRTGRWAVGVGATAMVAAGAVVAVTAGQSTPPGGHSAGGPRAASTSTVSGGQNVLLAAATTAEDTTDGSGRYWHLKMTFSDGGAAGESWRSRDGQLWVRGAKTNGDVREMPGAPPLRLAGVAISEGQLRSLPQDPTALRAWITNAVEKNSADGSVRTSGGKLSKAQRSELVVDSLASLVSQLPAPERVRAAAFRVLATLPGVRDLGPADGGRAISIPVGEHTARLVVDTGTGRVRGTNFVVTTDGGELWLPAGHTATVTGEWTDTLPH
ncbi:hypothetical protein Athai_04940 [Actinocatenispora thailandica]|uniref:CU044_5270 family protein n=1 Tax=Actinocatenispora thailandica TaxID=227318 RepID=A0A7R7HUY6_9ACTN|nr:CU044_5270 family protein [Actinocatenispora thailandica]BCJ32991.1 hypothetical protein Athai_04940 [Actinocatenispora thailandica]